MVELLLETCHLLCIPDVELIGPFNCSFCHSCADIFYMVCICNALSAGVSLRVLCAWMCVISVSTHCVACVYLFVCLFIYFSLVYLSICNLFIYFYCNFLFVVFDLFICSIFC